MPRRPLATESLHLAGHLCCGKATWASRGSVGNSPVSPTPTPGTRSCSCGHRKPSEEAYSFLQVDSVRRSEPPQAQFSSQETACALLAN